MNATDRKLSCKTDQQLFSALRRSLDDERAKLVDFLVLLAEFDARRLFAPMGFSSLFRFCVEGLGLSSDQAYRRVAAARAGRRFPKICRMLAEGSLHMSGVAVLAKHLDDGGEALVAAAAGKSKVELEAMVSTLDGAPEPRVTIRLVVSPETEALWRRARALSGEEPDEVFERAVAAYVERLEARKFKTTKRPRTEPKDAEPGKRSIAAAVKRAVTGRDERQCTFVAEDGRRCSETERLEFDHVVPVAKGGRSTVDNVRLRCRAHNQLAAEQVFGRAFMAKKRASLPGEGTSASVRTLPGPSAEPAGTQGTLPGQGAVMSRSTLPGPSAEPAGTQGTLPGQGAVMSKSTLPGPSAEPAGTQGTLPGQGAVMSRSTLPGPSAEPAGTQGTLPGPSPEAALRALDFNARDARALVEAARETMAVDASPEAWVCAALRAYRSGALERLLIRS